MNIPVPWILWVRLHHLLTMINFGDLGQDQVHRWAHGRGGGESGMVPQTCQRTNSTKVRRWYNWRSKRKNKNTVDGSEIRRQNLLRLVVYPIIYRVLYIPGGAGFLNHQQYLFDLPNTSEKWRWYEDVGLDPQSSKCHVFLVTTKN